MKHRLQSILTDPVGVTPWFLWLCALVFAGFGLVFSWAPLAAFGVWTGADLVGVTARIDLAATYGGFSLGIAAFTAWCALARSRWMPGVQLMLCIFVFFGGVRVFTLLRTDTWPLTMLANAVVEIGAVVLCLWLLPHLRRARS